LIKNVSQFDSQKSERQKRRIQRQQKQATTSMYEAHASQLIIPMQHNDEDLVNEEDINDCLQNKTDAVDGLLLLSQISKDVGIQVQEEELLNTRSVGIQCNGLDFKKDAELQVCTNEMLTVCDFIKTEKELSTATELKAFVLLHTIVELLSTIINDHRIHKLSLYKRVFLCFLKMKLDLPYSFLSILFGAFSQTCKNIFYEILVSLAPILKCAIPFPSKEEIKNHMPIYNTLL
jgi:hypothetical protein